jgi:hypothetical protein
VDGLTTVPREQPHTAHFVSHFQSKIQARQPADGQWQTVVTDLNGDGRSDVYLHNSLTRLWYQAITLRWPRHSLLNHADQAPLLDDVLHRCVRPILGEADGEGSDH